MTCERNCRKKGKEIIFNTFNDIFFLLFEQEPPRHVYFALGPTKYVDDPGVIYII